MSSWEAGGNATMFPINLKTWSVALDRAVLSILAERHDVTDPEPYLLHTEPCAKHDEHCARVVYGMFVEHVDWEETDPDELAERLLQSMLPPLPSVLALPEV